MSYFLTGLPRSRTAWFAEFLPDCLHEGMEGCRSRHEYVQKLGLQGDSSCALMYFPIADYFPEAPVVIVERDLDAVIDSLDSVGLFNNRVYVMLIDSLKRLNAMPGTRVDFEHLDLEEIWHILIGTELDYEHMARMDSINIQRVNYRPNVDAFNQLIGGTVCPLQLLQ